MQAYTAVLRALAASPMDWNKEKLLTELRRELHIEQESHYEVLNQVMDDPYLRTIRSIVKQGTETSRGAHDNTPQGVQRASMRPGARPRPSAGPEGLGTGTPRAAPGSPGTAGKSKLGKRLKRGTGGVAEEDIPRGKEMLGRKVWRNWPLPEGWVQGIITDYKHSTGEHIITYDKGTNKEQYEYFNFSLGDREEYSLSDQAPYEAQPAPAGPGTARQPPQKAAATAAPPPSKGLKRKAGAREPGTSTGKVGAGVPFDSAHFAQQLAGAGAAALHTMLVQLQRRERELLEQIAQIDDEHLEPSVRIKRQLARLAEREHLIQAQLAAASED